MLIRGLKGSSVSSDGGRADRETALTLDGAKALERAKTRAVLVENLDEFGI